MPRLNQSVKIIGLILLLLLTVATVQAVSTYTVTCDTSYTCKIFNGTAGSSYFIIPAGVSSVDYIAVGGGGGGGAYVGAGGGAGGLITGTISTSPGSNITLSIGGGGKGGTNEDASRSGGASTISSYTADGGGGGGGNVYQPGTTGGSGGGASQTGAIGGATQGNNGGAGLNSGPYYGTGGGGGYGSAGVDGTSTSGGNGGSGYNAALFGLGYVAAGGGGSTYTGAGTLGVGGSSIGGNAGARYGLVGTANTGSGGGGGGDGIGYGGNGTVGVVVIKYSTSPVASFASRNITAVTNSTSQGWASYVPLTMVFNSTSTGSITTYNYTAINYGNSTEFILGSTANISTTFQNSGNYSVYLNASSASAYNKTPTGLWVNTTLPFAADFTASTYSGFPILTVDYTDTSTGEHPDSWLWDFGDGNTSTLQNPSNSFVSPGIYTTNLTILNGSLVSTKLKTITVYTPYPVANFSGTPTSGTAPLSVTFTDLTTGSGLNSWNWTFGDGNTSTLQNPVHDYAAAGIYSVKLNVTGPDGYGEITKTNYITATELPTANFTASSYYGVTPLSVTFTDTSTGGILNWYWDFGDGNNSILQNPSHTFYSDGEYQVNLTVTNTNGVSTKFRNITSVAFGSTYTANPSTGPSPLATTFTETSYGLLVDSYYWDFGDGNTSTLQNPSNTYPHHGYYSVSHRVTNGSYFSWNNRTNYIEAWGQTASFTVSNTSASEIPLVVTFTSTSTDTNATPSSYLWVFGDGTQSMNGPSITHTYDSSFGVFNANLTTRNVTQGVSSTSALTTLSRIPSNTVSNISYNFVLNQMFPTTIMVKDSQTLALVGGSTITVSGVTYTLTNGILSNYFEYGSHTFLVEADGYASKTTSLFIVGNSTFTILIDPINGSSQTTWWTPHTVQLTVMSDSYGTRLPNVLVEAYYNESAMPTAWIETLYGIQSTAAGQMLNQSLTLGGTTGSDGTLTTSMLGSLKYDIYLTSAEYGLNRYHVSTYPSDYMLNIYVPITGQTLPTSGNSTYVYLNNTRLYITQPNISYVSMCIDYQDLSGTTSTVSELWWFGNNNSIFGVESFVNPGMSLVTNCKTLYNVRGTPVYWNYSAVTGI